MPDHRARPGPTPALLLGSLAFAALVTALRPPRPPSPAEKARLDAEHRARDAALARIARKKRDNDDRVAERKVQEARPEVSAEWLAIAYDRVTAARETGPFALRSLGPAGFRGIARRALLDTVTGDEVQVTGGDSADRWASGSVRVGWDGTEQGFGFMWSWGDTAQPTVLYLGYPAPGSPVDAAGLRVAVRLFNAEPALWTGSRPIVLQQRKPRFFGPDGQAWLDDEKRDFLDAKVDAAFRARGIDPDHGRAYDRDPTSLSALLRAARRQRRDR